MEQAKSQTGQQTKTDPLEKRVNSRNMFSNKAGPGEEIGQLYKEEQNYLLWREGF